MPVSIGSRLGPYEIVALLGAGGMGEVYKARDTHLDRFVAVKILPPANVADPGRKHRFVQEAKAASALNHPNIVTIYDIAEAEGVDYIAMEYIAGQTLDALIPRKGMRLPLALKYAEQVADALARAHARGIVHRDVKPSNVMVDEHGLVKVLDFGLAKLTEAAGEDAETATGATVAGTLLGTAAYMSPEQAEGKPVDARSDIFSFGSMLYEMLTGQRAFRGDSAASTVAAILREEPKPIGQVVDALPHDVETLVRRCLQKDVERRFQHMDDVKVALAELREDSASGKMEASPQPSQPPRRRWLPWATSAAVLVAGAAGALIYYQRLQPSQSPLKVVPLTSYPGVQRYPSLSPDGREVAFSWNGEKEDNFDIYVQMVAGGSPQRLTTDPAADTSPSWSPDGNRIAFLRGGAVYLISPRGGDERRLCRAAATSVAWGPDGRSLFVTDRASGEEPLALYQVSLESGQARRITSPPAGYTGDTQPAPSPDGRLLAFARRPTALGNDAYVLSLGGLAPTGEPGRLTNDAVWILGFAWTSDSKEVVFSSERSGRTGLWRTAPSPGAEAQPIPGTDDGRWPVISRVAPARLVFERYYSDTNIWRMELTRSNPAGGIAKQIIASTAMERDPRFSPDGTRIAFVSVRSGYPEIWLAADDGSRPVQLTSFAGKRTAGAPSWSPDGRQIVFDSMAGGIFDIFVIDVERRLARQLTDDPAADSRPSWSRDGRWIYFGSNRSGSNQVWKMPPEGRNPTQVTRHGGWEAMEADDGRTVYYTMGFDEAPGLWRVPVGGGEETLAIEGARHGHWGVAREGIFFVDFEGLPPRAPKPLRLFEFASGKISPSGVIERITLTANASFSVRWDGGAVIWAQNDRLESNIMLIDNFR